MSSWQNVIGKVLTLAKRYPLFSKRDRIILGISGGLDSMVLASLFLAVRRRFQLIGHVAHINYGRRGEDSDADQTLVMDWAKHHDLSCDLHAPRFSGTQGNFQAWARTERYGFFAELATRYGANKVAVAHHATDQVETFLLRLLRGSGVSGLSGMRPVTLLQGTTVIRPLLTTTRAELVAAAAEQKIPYREDQTNLKADYQRNRLRQTILPQLRELQAHLEELLSDNMLLWQGDEDYLEQCAEEALVALTLGGAPSELKLDALRYRQLPRSLRLRVLRRGIAQLTGTRQSITFHHVIRIDELACQAGGKRPQYQLPGKLCFYKEPRVLVLKVT